MEYCHVNIKNKQLTGEIETSVASASYLTAQSKSSRARVGRRKATGQKTIESEGASARPQRMRSDKICHPMGYGQAKEEKTSESVRKRRQSNPYAKSGFVWEFSSDD